MKQEKNLDEFFGEKNTIGNQLMDRVETGMGQRG